MTTDEPAQAEGHDRLHAEGARPGDHARTGAAGKNGGREPAANPVAPQTLAELPPVRRSQSLRLVYWVLWFLVLPVVLTCSLIWALTPHRGHALPSGAIEWLQSIVHGQPAAVGILLFTVVETALGAARHQLPFAKHAHPPLRSDLSPRLRARFGRARTLLDEAEMILTRHSKAVVRELTARERERLHAHLEGLREAMDGVPLDEEVFMDALVRADGDIDVRLGRWRKSALRELLEVIVMAVAVALALRAFVIQAFKIPSGSMIPSLMVGDHLFVSKFSYGPAIPYTHTRVWTSMPPLRGDVIVFASPEHPEQDFIKRVIAIGGDKLEAKNGHPVINGWEVPSCRVGSWSYSDHDSPPAQHAGDFYVEYLGRESYLTFYDKPSASLPENQGPYFAKKGEVWVMGDNRNNSLDSRMWFGGQGGGVPFENIRGRALFVWLSVSDNSIDWSREGAPVMGRPRLPPSASGLGPQFAQCLRSRPAVTDAPGPSSSPEGPR
ncbi:MAG: signal peptidase I [Polyangiaceae bacterium]